MPHPPPYTFPTAQHEQAYGWVATGQNPAATAWITQCPGCKGWNGATFITYVGASFNGMTQSMQETMLVHEMGHPYTGYGAPMDNSGIYSYENIQKNCGTDLPVTNK